MLNLLPTVWVMMYCMVANIFLLVFLQFFTLSVEPSRSAFTRACSLWISPSLILMTLRSSDSCWRSSVSRTECSSRSFSSCSLARSSLTAAADLCCSWRTSCIFSRSSLLTYVSRKKRKWVSHVRGKVSHLHFWSPTSNRFVVTINLTK